MDSKENSLTENLNPDISSQKEEKISEIPSIMIKLEKFLNSFENKGNGMKSLLSLIYFLIFILFILINILIKTQLELKTAIIEVFFVIFLVNFLINYYFLRIYEVNPYLQNDQDNDKSKKYAFSFLFGLIFFIYSIKNMDLKLNLLILPNCWIFSLFLEKNMQLNFFYIIGAICVSLGSYNSLNVTNYQGDFKSMCSLFLCTFLLSYSFSGVYKLRNKASIFTINHIFSMISLLFFPIFFPIEEIVQPGIILWIFMLISGILFFFVSLCFFKSLKLKKGSRLFIFCNLAVIFKYYDLVGCILIIVGCFLVLFLDTVENEEVEIEKTSSNIEKSANGDIEMKNLTK